MPLPRFDRLAEPEQRRLIAAAILHLAERGRGDISLNDLADEAGISRSALYNYFDGRDDVIVAATRAAFTQVMRTLGPWESQSNESAFWAQFHVSSARLRALMSAHPELRVILADAGGGPDPWIDELFANAMRLGIVTTANEPLARAATGAVISAADELERDYPGSHSHNELQELLKKMWA